MTTAQAATMLRDLFGQAHSVPFVIQLWDGSAVSFGEGDPVFTVTFRDQDTFANLIRSQNTYAFAMAYVENRLDMTGDFEQALQLKTHLKKEEPSLIAKLKVLWRLGFHGMRHAPEADQKNVQAHYDISNEVYQMMLDTKVMAYSCAYYHDENESLEDAQEHKVDLVCRKLRLKPGERFLDIGCGWGGLVIHAAKHYGVKAHGLTLSKNQYELACQRVTDAGLQDQITIELRDYRDLKEGTYDKIASIGMYEHVGISQYPTYFKQVWNLLREGGLFLNHGITTRANESFGGERKFVFTHIFPGSELDVVSHTNVLMEDAGFEVLNVECLRPHYAKTLREWFKRLTVHEEKMLTLIPERIYRAWKLYLGGLPLSFDEGNISVAQTLAAKSIHRPAEAPLTPHDVYCS